mmetsp:Transcript_109616/g.283320  ORF Transcript_109616/g.283320 Transcript_109616/m.283320 type:complete len:260 (+) Transcript_109616:1486-2265(+)
MSLVEPARVFLVAVEVLTEDKVALLVGALALSTTEAVAAEVMVLVMAASLFLPVGTSLLGVHLRYTPRKAAPLRLLPFSVRLAASVVEAALYRRPPLIMRPPAHRALLLAASALKPLTHFGPFASMLPQLPPQSAAGDTRFAWMAAFLVRPTTIVAFCCRFHRHRHRHRRRRAKRWSIRRKRILRPRRKVLPRRPRRKAVARVQRQHRRRVGRARVERVAKARRDRPPEVLRAEEPLRKPRRRRRLSSRGSQLSSLASR